MWGSGGARTLFGVYGRRAFTLTELLIVLGIVGLLIGLLLPALNAARQAAWQVRCAANLRQVGVALAVYAARERMLPYAAVLGRDVRDTDPAPVEQKMVGLDFFAVSWDDLLNRDLGGDLTELELAASLSPRSRATLICPADRTPRVYTVPFHMLSYAIVEGPTLADAVPGRRDFLGTAGVSWKPDFWARTPLRFPISIRPTDVPRPAETFVVLDYAMDYSAQGMSISRAGIPWSHYTSTKPDGQSIRFPIPPPHRGRFNALYHDGHVAAVLEPETLGTGTPTVPRGPWTIDPND